MTKNIDQKPKTERRAYEAPKLFVENASSTQSGANPSPPENALFNDS